MPLLRRAGTPKNMPTAAAATAPASDAVMVSSPATALRFAAV
jgi:hypothetical protein